ncbi:MAG: hypothetical protein ACTTKL_01120 [Treponema sp.]
MFNFDSCRWTAIAGAVAYVIIVVSIPLWRRFILRRAGKCILAAGSKNALLPALIVLGCAALIAIVWVKRLGMATDIIVLSIAVFGAAIGSSEIALNGSGGVYENGLIGGGRFLPLSEIYALPLAASLDNGGDAQFNRTAIKVITNKRGAISFLYESPDECKAVAEALSALVPSLRGE